MIILIIILWVITVELLVNLSRHSFDKNRRWNRGYIDFSWYRVTNNFKIIFTSYYQSNNMTVLQLHWEWKENISLTILNITFQFTFNQIKL